ncbi:MAG: hypothetical protein M3N45_08920 [Actinomycetota bacterium]|nr:hypothetical protein [Actinomycetota bacterium]
MEHPNVARAGVTSGRAWAVAAGLTSLLLLLLLAGCASGEGGQNKGVEENGGGNVASAAQPGVALGNGRR